MKRALLNPYILSLSILLICTGIAVAEVRQVPSQDWREYYRRMVSVELLKQRSDKLLVEYRTDDPVLNELIVEARQGRIEDALKRLQVLRISTKDKRARDEYIFLTGLLYERRGFYPEALGNYERIVPEEGEGMLYRSLLLRKAFVKLIKGIDDDNVELIKEAEADFAIVYNDAEDSNQWREAALGYGISMFEMGEYEFALMVLKEVEAAIVKEPAMWFYQGENYFRLGRFDEAERIFKNIPEISGRYSLLSYLLLRSGDISLRTNKPEEAKSLYQRLVKGDDEGAKYEGGYGYVMGQLALAEIDEEKGRGREAVLRLKDALGSEGGVDIKDVILYRLIQLSSREGMDEDTLLYSRRLLPMERSEERKQEILKIVNKTILKLLHHAFENKNFIKVLSLYNENKELIRDRRILITVGKTYLALGLTGKAKEIFSIPMVKKDKKTPIRWAEILLYEGEVDKAKEILDTIYTRFADLKDIGHDYSRLGDIYYREGRLKDALYAYRRAVSIIDEPSLLLRMGDIYHRIGRDMDAVNVYRSVLRKRSDKSIKRKAVIRVADIYYSMKMWEDALTFYKMGLNMISDLHDRLWVTYRMGEINFILGRHDRAIEAWKKVQDNGKDYIAELAQERIKEARLWKDIRM